MDTSTGRAGVQTPSSASKGGAAMRHERRGAAAAVAVAARPPPRLGVLPQRHPFTGTQQGALPARAQQRRQRARDSGRDDDALVSLIS